MSALKNGVLLRNRKAENRPLMKVICSLLLLAPCLSALMISCCKYFLINVKLRVWRLFLFIIALRLHFSIQPLYDMLRCADCLCNLQCCVKRVCMSVRPLIYWQLQDCCSGTNARMFLKWSVSSHALDAL